MGIIAIFAFRNNKSMRSAIFFTAILTLFSGFSTAHAQRHNAARIRTGEPPALVINIVVGGLGYGTIEKYYDNLSASGFRLFAEKGVVFTESRYDFMQTNSPAALATLTTGANPCVHGVIGEQWQDYITGERIGLIDDAAAQGLGSDTGIGAYSYTNLTVPTLADQLKKAEPRSKAITIAADPVSAVSMGGMSSDVYWLDVNSLNWTSSSKYMLYLPGWVSGYNDQNGIRKSSFRNYSWTPGKSEVSYINSRFCILDIPETVRFRKIPRMVETTGTRSRYSEVFNTPVSDEMVVELARQAIIYEDLGKDRHTDILNVCFDAHRNAVRLYGPESIEAEDMLYRVDKLIATLVDFAHIQIGEGKILFVLTSDHGSSDSYDITMQHRPRFNGDQFRIVMNTFLGAQFGEGEWVSDYYDRRLYLNRNTVYRMGLSLEDVQMRVANFALQFRGISHALTSSAMQNGGFSDSFLRKVQNGFYPRRSGDLTINLMAGWIEDREGTRASAGSLYDYDTHVPLMVMGAGLPHRVVTAGVDMASLAPTLARIMCIERPAASTAPTIGELLELF